MADAARPRLRGALRSPAEPYGALHLEPASTVLNYGQGVIEGMQADVFQLLSPSMQSYLMSA